MNLFENFNTTNQTRPYFQRHDNFVIELKPPGCALAQIQVYEERCAFVRQTNECRENVQLFDYTDIFYCKIDPRNTYEETVAVLFVMFMGYTFMGFVGTATESFFCPALKVFTNILGISQNLAGITLLAIGNSAPDIIKSLSSLNQPLGPIYSDTVGSAMFITAFIAGVIIIMKPFHVVPSTFIRDVAYYIFAIAFINYSIKVDRTVNLWESIVMICLYPAYLVIIMVDQYFLVYTIKRLTKNVEDSEIVSESDRERLKLLQMEAGIEITIKPVIRTSSGNSKPATFEAKSSNDRLFRQLLVSMMPVELSVWRAAGLCKRIYIVSRFPVDVIIYAIVPAVDYDLEIMGWSKLLNCIQIVLLPVVLLALNARDATAWGYPYWMFSLIVTVPLAIGIFLITRTDKAPKFHLIFAVASIWASVSLIQVFTQELINIIVLFGLITYRSLSFLGCTISSFGDSFGDLLASIILARHGYQKMGLAACIAGPLFYLTLGLGSVFVYKCAIVSDHQLAVTQGSMGENCTIFLLSTLTGMLIAGVATNFYLRRSIGFFLVILYILFNVYCLLGEFEVIHPYGTDHSEDMGVTFM